MVEVKVLPFGTISECFEQECYRIPEGTTVAAFFRMICKAKQEQQLESLFFGEDGRLRQSVLILVNDSSTYSLNGDQTVLLDGDVLNVISVDLIGG